MTDDDFITELQTLKAKGPDALPEIKRVIAKEGGFSRVIGLLRKPKKAKGEQHRTKLGNYAPNDRARELAVAYWKNAGRSDLDLTNEIGKFQAHHRKKGDTAADWSAAWQTWYSNAVTFSRPQYGSQPSRQPGDFDPTDDRGWRDRLMALERESVWPDSWGPRPGEPGCKVPAALLVRTAS